MFISHLAFVRVVQSTAAGADNKVTKPTTVKPKAAVAATDDFGSPGNNSDIRRGIKNAHVRLPIVDVPKATYNHFLATALVSLPPIDLLPWADSARAL